jgi:triacylglycerol esterase/lipase EstA (alpha/beta hydrolase family)
MRLRRLLAGGLAFALAATALGSVNAHAAPAAADEPEPVVIVAGTTAAQPIADVFYSTLAHRLERDGFEPFIFGLPGGGLSDIADTAQALSDFTDGVLAATGDDTVSLVGHSQGGLVGRYYIRFLGGEANVDNMVSLATPHRGTDLARLAELFRLGDIGLCVACEQMAPGSDFLAALNAGDDSFGDVEYTNLVTRFDEIVFPFANGLLQPDGNNTNVTVQDQCFFRLVGHLTMATDGTVYSGVRQALQGQDDIRLNCFAL